MQQSDDHSAYDQAINILVNGSADQMAALEGMGIGFPNGLASSFGHRWITSAINFGSLSSIKWMLGRGVDLEFETDEGFTVLHSCIDRPREDKYEVLELLLNHGASVDLHGLNDWTAAHMAVVRDDIEALRLLVRFGSDLSIRTRIDNYETPFEAAQSYNSAQALHFLKGLA